MQVIRHDDGSVTVRIPKAPEVYEPKDGQLYIEETLTKADWREALKPAAKTKEPSDV